MPSSRSSVSSDGSDLPAAQMSMSKRWATLETVGRCMFLFSVAFFIMGVLLTVFGFSNTGIGPNHRLPLQILGPLCLAMTLVMWAVGCVFSRLWNMEWKRQQQAMELRDRVQLHALAMDILNNPVISPAMLQDPRIRRQLMMKLRQQKALDVSSSEAFSRRSSRAISVGSQRKQSSVSAAFQQELGRRKSKGTINGDEKPCFELPGIQISRIETLDLSDGMSIASGTGSKGKRYIIIHSDYSSDFSRLSCPSDYSLHSRSSRSRSSRASSQVSSRLWDFSPRESEWDADISIGSRDSQYNVSKQDWGGGPSDYGSDYMLSPTAPRKASVVTFDVNPFRRHSSPASAGRRKDSGCECTCGRSSTEYPSQSSLKNRDASYNTLRYPDEGRMSISSASSRKKSADHSIYSFRIDEQDDDEDAEATPLTATNESQRREEKECNIVYSTERRGSLRPPLKRNNTDDSEVERRVARLFKEIEYSVTDSVDESRINSQEYETSVRNVEAREAETQTMEDDNLFDKSSEADTVIIDLANANITNVHVRSKGRHDSAGSCSDNLRESFESNTDVNLDHKSYKSKEKRSKLAAISSALASFGRRSLSQEKKPSVKNKSIPRRLLAQGLSDEKESVPLKSAACNTDLEAAFNSEDNIL